MTVLVLFSGLHIHALAPQIALKILIDDWNIPPSHAIRHSLQKCPALVNALIQTQHPAAWFAQVGRLRKDRLICMIEKHPTLMAQALTSTELVSIQSFLQQSLGFTTAQWKRLNRKGQVATWSRTNVRQTIQFFRNIMDESLVTKVILSCPQLLLYKTDRLQEPIDYFLRELALNNDQVTRMVAICPIILTLNVDTNLRPTVRFLQSLGSDNWDGWRTMMIRYPQLLTHSVENVLKPKLEFVETTLLDLQIHDSLRRIVSRFPPIFWLSPDLLQHKVNYLSQKVDLTADEMKGVILTFPQILGLSVDQNVEPTITFLLTSLTQKELKTFFLYQPSLFAYSLEKRIRPRLEQLQANGIVFAYSPPYLMSLSNDKFQQWYVDNPGSIGGFKLSLLILYFSGLACILHRGL